MHAEFHLDRGRFRCREIHLLVTFSRERRLGYLSDASHDAIPAVAETKSSPSYLSNHLVCGFGTCRQSNRLSRLKDKVQSTRRCGESVFQLGLYTVKLRGVQGLEVVFGEEQGGDVAQLGETELLANAVPAAWVSISMQLKNDVQWNTG